MVGGDNSEIEFSEHVPMAAIAKELANFCREKQSGTLYLITPDSNSASFCLDFGEIIYIRFGSARNDTALLHIANTAKARFYFADRTSYFGSRAKLPPTREILQRLGFTGIPTHSDNPAYQADEVRSRPETDSIGESYREAPSNRDTPAVSSPAVVAESQVDIQSNSTELPIETPEMADDSLPEDWVFEEPRQRYSEKKYLLVSLLCLPFLVLVLASFFIANQPSARRERSPLLAWTRWGQEPETSSKPEVGWRMSTGSRILLAEDTTPTKQLAAQAYANHDYQTAIALFERSLQRQRNDPEAAIYRSNAVAASTGNAIELGVSVPIGSNPNIAKEMLRGVAQAQLEINDEGGLNGQPILIHVANDDNDPEISPEIARQFVETESILGVIGHNSSKATIAAAPVYNDGKLVVVSPTSIAAELSGIGSYVFRTTPSTPTLASVLARHAIQTEQLSNFAICADSTDQASLSFKEEFTQAVADYNGTVAMTQCDFAADDFELTTVHSQLSEENVDALVLSPEINGINHAIDIAKVNRGRLSLFGSQTLYTFSTLAEGNIDVEGMVLSVAWHPDATESSEYLSQARRLWGDAGNVRTALAYDATQSLLRGLNDGTSRIELQQALASSDFSFAGATGEVKFLSTGDRRMPGVLIQVQPGQRSGTGYDFRPITVEGQVRHSESPTSGAS